MNQQPSESGIHKILHINIISPQIWLYYCENLTLCVSFAFMWFHFINNRHIPCTFLNTITSWRCLLKIYLRIINMRPISIRLLNEIIPS